MKNGFELTSSSGTPSEGIDIYVDGNVATRLKPIEYDEQRVLTTQQLADGYETSTRRISENFNSNKNRYTEGKHYYCLEGAILREFKGEYGNSVVAENLNKLYLWTEKGALLHAKSLNTDKAWDVYDTLVETYFRMVDLIQRRSDILPSYPELLRQHADLLEENERLQVEAVGYRLIADATGGTLSLNEFAKSMNWGRNRFSRLMREKGVFMDGGAIPYQQYITSGYFIVRERTACDGNIYPYSLITPRGVDYIVKKVQQWGLAEELIREGRRELVAV